jgi:hypothetical protein
VLGWSGRLWGVNDLQMCRRGGGFGMVVWGLRKGSWEEDRMRMGCEW